MSESSHVRSKGKVRLDPRVTQLIEHGVASKSRSLFLIVGDQSRELVVPLHQLLARARSQAQSRPSLLWCYKKDLGFTTHRKKRMKELQKKMRAGLIDPKEGDPWELFISSTNVRYCYYAETYKVLGNTFGACVLQDFEALTPNILARTIETVEGGGLIIILLRTLQSLKQLYTLTMDVHARFRTESHQDVVGRFNERFLLSLTACHAFLALDDTYHVLPLSSKSLKHLNVEKNPGSDATDELKKLKDSLADTKPLIDVLKCCCTLDQSKSLLKLADCISDKTLRATVAITAARGRGKSACMGLALSIAISFGYGAIFVTSPSPENLRTLFEFLFKGLDALGYEEHTDYEVLRSANPEFRGAVTRLNVSREHRQIVQYIRPNDAHFLSHAELLVIDEAAAIPLPLVRKLMGPYLVFMASTVNGYEGTGRSLSLKLIDQLRKQCVNKPTDQDATGVSDTSRLSSSRLLHEVSLEEPIRYAPGDLVEKWLHDLLCLDVNKVPRIFSGCPSPSECDLYFVNRDTLFSCHKASEQFLHRMMSLYVSSHYRNTPNDLQLMSDAPAHMVFVLLGPASAGQSNLPEILSVLQVCLEGSLSKSRIKSGLSKGFKASGDLIPWTVSEQFQDFEFCGLSGARVVRIATHPDFQGMGYGSRALSLLKQYYSGLIACSGGESAEILTVDQIDPDEKDTLLSEQIKPRQNLPPLLLQLSERRAEKLDFLGVSYGVTEPLLKFWKRAGYLPVYLRQTANELTGEHTVLMLQSLAESTHTEWLDSYWTDFTRRFVQLLSYQFKAFPVSLALNVLYRKRNLSENSSNELTAVSSTDNVPMKTIRLDELYILFTKYDLKRLYLYSRQMVDYHLIVDLLPAVARLYFLQRTDFKLSLAQCAVLLGIGLQHKSVDEISKEIDLPSTQLLGLFNRSMKKFAKFFRELEEAGVSENMPTESVGVNELARGGEEITLEEELGLAAKEVKLQQERELQALLQSDLSHFSVTGAEQDWEMALGAGKQQSIVSIPSSAKRKGVDTDQILNEMDQMGSKKKSKKHAKTS